MDSRTTCPGDRAGPDPPPGGDRYRCSSPWPVATGTSRWRHCRVRPDPPPGGDRYRCSSPWPVATGTSRWRHYRAPPGPPPGGDRYRCSSPRPVATGTSRWCITECAQIHRLGDLRSLFTSWRYLFFLLVLRPYRHAQRRDLRPPLTRLASLGRLGLPVEVRPLSMRIQASAQK
jgi:hypothetical protein